MTIEARAKCSCIRSASRGGFCIEARFSLKTNRVGLPGLPRPARPRPFRCQRSDERAARMVAATADLRFACPLNLSNPGKKKSHAPSGQPLPCKRSQSQSSHRCSLAAQQNQSKRKSLAEHRTTVTPRSPSLPDIKNPQVEPSRTKKQEMRG